MDTRANVPCETCGDPTPYEGTRRCALCYEVELRLNDYLDRPGGRMRALRAMEIQGLRGGFDEVAIHRNPRGRTRSMTLSYTNSSLRSARNCLRLYYLDKELLLSPESESRVALDVGTTWHEAHSAKALDGRGEPNGDVSNALGGGMLAAWQAIEKHAPSTLWRTKLWTLFRAYFWRWQEWPLDVAIAEGAFAGDFRGRTLAGKRDGIVRLPDGREALLEYKTTSESIDVSAPYWKRLRLDPQLGIYGATLPEFPSAIIYDVVRKPSIEPKGVLKTEQQRIEREVAHGKTGGEFVYYQARFNRQDLDELHANGWRETEPMYAARLMADIGERPDFYFARREVPRTGDDYAALLDDVEATIETIEFARERGRWPRNPDHCDAFGGCRFFALCQNNVLPRDGDVPTGFIRRDALHPELVVDGQPQA